MPNWCENQLSIYGHKDDMQNLLDVIKVGEDNYILLENLYPTPADLLIGDAPMTNHTEQQKANLEKHGYPDWYQWRVDKWGTKWCENDLYVTQEYTERGDEAEIAFYFESAWSPPIEAFHKIAQDYPNLLFCLYYEEPGMAFCGKNVWAKGECVEEEESDLIGRHFDEQYLYNTYYKEGK